MSAAKYNLFIDQGSDFAIQFTLSEDSATKDLTGYDARAQLRLKKLDTTAAATFTCTVPQDSSGIIHMEMNNSTTKDIAAGLYFYDLELYTPNDGNVTRILEGQVTVTQEVTR